jgi:mannose-6-phosphate isomerase-like protein (cupin superfamily)
MSGVVHTRYADITPFRTKDGSEIRELMHPNAQAARRQSLAEATVAPGAQTALHRHPDTEELYHIVAGSGRMTLAEREFEVHAGDTICIAPGTPHCIANIGAEPLRLLCCCAPAYRDDDTELM